MNTEALERLTVLGGWDLEEKADAYVSALLALGFLGEHPSCHDEYDYTTDGTTCPNCGTKVFHEEDFNTDERDADNDRLSCPRCSGPVYFALCRMSCHWLLTSVRLEEEELDCRWHRLGELEELLSRFCGQGYERPSEA